MKLGQTNNLLSALLLTIILCVAYSCGSGGEKKKGFQPKFDDKPTIYKVRVKTSCDSLAGTEAVISMIIKGEKGESKELLIEKPDGGKITPCETTNLEFPVERDLGQLKQLEVWHDNSNDNPSWMPEIITVINVRNNVRWDFPCGKWFDKEQFDQRIQRTFYTNKECN